MGKVLIADDVELMRTLLIQVVEALELEYVQASTGDQVLEILKDDSDIDLVLLDIGMPKLDGIQAVRLIRDINKSVKVCFVSGSKDKSVVAQAISSGGDDYVVKPIDVAILQQKIRKLLGQSTQDSFTVVAAMLSAKISNVPLEMELWVTSLSEVGCRFHSPMPLSAGNRIDLEIPRLVELLGEELTFCCQIDAVSFDQNAGIHVADCSFVGMHENHRALIRSLTVKGQKIE